ncbi:MAG: DUF192 domain-containing protein [Candidatus Eremiobacteraeota bacterium]|nr:DUF192 domain-containing protein [Candidatus Eremiobacteraeota bacterium]MBV8644697.1 DUF192 domain-containing protein [Candidatus Eremiobacteraeota bacterium]
MAALKNHSTRTIVATRIGRPMNFLARLVGLIGRRDIEPDEGLWFERCTSIHTFGMRSAIDVVFADARGRVLALKNRLVPGRIAFAPPGATTIVELGPGALDRLTILVGDQLELVDPLG